MGYGLEHDSHTMTAESVMRGYGLYGPQPHFVFHNLPTFLEASFLEYLDDRADFFECDDSFPAGATDLMIHNNSQTPLTIKFYGCYTTILMPTTRYFILFLPFCVENYITLVILIPRSLILALGATNIDS